MYSNFGADDEPNRLAAIELTVELLEQILPMEEGTRVVRVYKSNRTPNALTIVVSNERFRELLWGERIPVAIARIDRGDHGELGFVEWIWPGVVGVEGSEGE